MIKITLTQEDGSTIDFVPASTETVDVTPGESVDVVAETAPESTPPAA